MVVDSKVIVALDINDKKLLLELLNKLDPNLCKIKVGKECFVQFGPEIINICHGLGFKVFLDLKFHDIPNTVSRACKVAADLGVWMLDIHASGGEQMMSLAAESLLSYGSSRPLLIAVTVLTSFNQQDLSQIGVKENLADQVLLLGTLANNSGCDGVVCAPFESKLIKEQINQDFLCVTPGIRLQVDSQDDQKRVLTPAEAFKNGADYLVMGRSIIHSDSPNLILEEIYR